MQLQAGKIELTDSDFLKLIQAKEGSIYRVAYGYVQNAEDAKDIVQDAVCKAYVGKQHLKDTEKFYPWFYRILTNTALSFLRQSRRTIPIELEQLNLLSGSEDDEARWNDALAVQESLGQLSGKVRTVIVMKFYEDMTFAEIAQIMKKPEATVKSLYYRGLRLLRERMQFNHGESSYPSRNSG